MNHKTILTGVCALLVALGATHAQTTAFSYQGRLNSATGPATGLYDFTFNLHALAEGGGPLSGAVAAIAVPVTNGLFTVTLNFGHQFPGADRWLEIAVRTNGGGVYATLAPRQPLTATPHAIRALSAGSAATASTATNVVASSIIGASIATNVVDSSKITDGTITASDLGGPLLSNTFWRLTGNAGTTAGVNFLGTTDEKEFEVRANNTTALRINRINTTTNPNLIGGFGGNLVGSGYQGGVIAGGGTLGQENRITAGNYSAIGGGAGNVVLGATSVIGGGSRNLARTNNATVAGGTQNSAGEGGFVGGGLSNYSGSYGVVGGGNLNQIFTYAGVIGGGENNTLNGSHAIIGGGRFNGATNNYAAVLGGLQNSASGPYATVGGGTANQAWGEASAIPGGANNQAGPYALAAGYGAWALHPGSFVWADFKPNGLISTASNQFLVRASGGFGINTNRPQDALHVNGSYLRVTGAGGEGAYFGGDGFANDVELGSVNAAVGAVALWNRATSSYMDLIADQITASQFNGPLNGSLSGTFSGGVSASNFKLGTTSVPGSVLTSDSSGNGSWSSGLRVSYAERLTGTPPFQNYFSSANLLGGSSYNVISSGVIGATLLGGGSANGTVNSVIPPTVRSNYVGADFASVLGGRANAASGSYATVSGGYSNLASGSYSFAAGQRAKANHQGTFAWADSQNSDFASSANNQFLIRAGGGVGINTPSPQSALDVNGDTTVRGNLVLDGNNANDGTLYPGLVFAPGSGEGIGSRRTDGDNQYGLDFYTGFNRRFSIGNGGSVNLHDNTLHLRGTTDANHGLGYRSTFATHGVDGPALFGYAGGALGTTEGGENWSLRWDKNEVKVKVLTITGGMDLAEPFTMKEEAIEPGSVVVIDDEHPGRLKLSGQAYDTRVAGIVSGAGGVKPGIALHQEGIQEGGQNVALSGRVYVKADATQGAIRPGDLLTTSERPGHAMKVGEHGRSQGAILGKAMSTLKDGTGLVLVLVTLQ